jgi:hypothetical protein
MTAPEVRLLNAKYLDDCSTVTAKVFDEEVAANRRAGTHMVQNVLAVLGAAQSRGGHDPVCHALASLNRKRGAASATS